MLHASGKERWGRRHSAERVCMEGYTMHSVHVAFTYLNKIRIHFFLIHKHLLSQCVCMRLISSNVDYFMYVLLHVKTFLVSKWIYNSTSTTGDSQLKLKIWHGLNKLDKCCWMACSMKRILPSTCIANPSFCYKLSKRSVTGLGAADRHLWTYRNFFSSVQVTTGTFLINWFGL